VPAATTELEEPAVRAPLRSVLVGFCALSVALLAAAPASAEGPQRSATPSVTAEIGYAHEQVQAGGQDTMTVSLVNHGPQNLDDQTSVHVTVTMPQHTEVDPNVVQTIPGNAPSGSNAAPSTRTVPLAQLFTRSAPSFFDVVIPAGSFGNAASFRQYAFTLHIARDVAAGSQLVGGGVAVALENYVGLTVAKAKQAAPPPPVVVPPSKPKTKPETTPGTPGAPGTPKSGGSGSSRSGSGGRSSSDASRGCPVGMDQDTAHQGTAPGTGRHGGAQCSAGGLASTGADTAWPLALAVLALAAGAVLLRIAHRSGRD
jgi:hypothetical protein